MIILGFNIKSYKRLYTIIRTFISFSLVFKKFFLRKKKSIFSFFLSDFDLHEYRHYYLAENWKISKRVRKTHQLSPSKLIFKYFP